MKVATTVLVILSVLLILPCKVRLMKQLKIEYDCKQDSDCPLNEVCILDKQSKVKQGLCAKVPEESIDTIGLDLHKDVEIAKSRPVIVE